MMDLPALVVQDDFLANPHALRSMLLSDAEFGDIVNPVDGQLYPTVCQTHQPLDEVIPKLAMLHCCADVDVKLSCFRLGLRGEQDDQFCHYDSDYAQRAAVLYLNEGQQNAGGTAFWRHKAGFDRMPDKASLAAAGMHPEDFQKWIATQCALDARPNWDLCAYAGLKWNRLISYPTSVFHSRFPNDLVEPFGDTKETGRLVWVAFYTPLFS